MIWSLWGTFDINFFHQTYATCSMLPSNESDIVWTKPFIFYPDPDTAFKNCLFKLLLFILLSSTLIFILESQDDLQIKKKLQGQYYPLISIHSVLFTYQRYVYIYIYAYMWIMWCTIIEGMRGFYSSLYWVSKKSLQISSTYDSLSVYNKLEFTVEEKNFHPVLCVRTFTFSWEQTPWRRTFSILFRGFYLFCLVHFHVISFLINAVFRYVSIVQYFSAFYAT